MTDPPNIAALESVIASVDGVTGCVVTTNGLAHGKVLVAHISTAPHARVPLLRVPLDGKGLPVPHHIACWEVLPSGQGDRGLRLLDGETVGGDCMSFGLDTMEKRRIAEVWAGILLRASLGTGDSFLELGGHSLLAIRMLAAVGEAFEVRVPIYEFLDDPTISGLAKQVAQKTPRPSSNEDVPVTT